MFLLSRKLPNDSIFRLCNRYNLKKLTFDERKKKLVERLKAFNDAGNDDDSDDDDDEY